MATENNKTIIEVSALSIDWLNKYPIWTWYEGSLFERENFICPVNDLDVSEYNQSTAMFAASFTTIENQLLRGVLLYDIDIDNVYCIGLFYNGEEFNFSVNLKKLFSVELQRLRTHAANENLMIFPLQYQCDVSNIIGVKSVGTFG